MRHTELQYLNLQVILSDKMEEKINNMQLQQEINNYKDDMKDLQEKLDTLKVKRAQDKVLTNQNTA